MLFHFPAYRALKLLYQHSVCPTLKPPPSNCHATIYLLPLYLNDFHYDNKPTPLSFYHQINNILPLTSRMFILLIQRQHRPRRYGGGIKATEHQEHDIHSVSSSSIVTASTGDWHPLPLDILQRHSPHISGQTLQYWRPEILLPHQPSNHPLVSTIPNSTLTTIKSICQFHPETPIIRSSRRRNVFLQVKDIRDLVSYGSAIADETVTMYLELLCHTHDICYLSTSFISELQEHGWEEVQRYFVQPNRRNRSRSINCPHCGTEPVTIIPAHIHDSHWVGIVRRVIHQRVIFFYSDDMNNSADELHLCTLIQTRTSPEFCPDSALWINCASNFYVKHSNECGPRTLAACHILALHPHPYKEMLLPLMDSNLAQILRTWIASSLIQGTINSNHLQGIISINRYPDNRTTHRALSSPHDIIPWDIQTREDQPP
jgi:hypothetical protein